MLKDLQEILQELLHKIANSRLIALGAIFTAMFVILIVKLFNLQIVAGEKYLSDYERLTQREVSIPGTRGNIYDCNGYLLAYNEPAYLVSIQDIGAYPDSASMNAMLLRLRGEDGSIPAVPKPPVCVFCGTITGFVPWTASMIQRESIPQQLVPVSFCRRVGSVTAWMR